MNLRENTNYLSVKYKLNLNQRINWRGAMGKRGCKAMEVFKAWAMDGPAFFADMTQRMCGQPVTCVSTLKSWPQTRKTLRAAQAVED